MGSDHEGNLDYLRDQGINIQYLSRTDGVSTSMLKKIMKEGNRITFDRV
jgi:lambda repressor-like predicted transcriptional regulator